MEKQQSLLTTLMGWLGRGSQGNGKYGWVFILLGAGMIPVLAALPVVVLVVYMAWEPPAPAPPVVAVEPTTEIAVVVTETSTPLVENTTVPPDEPVLSPTPAVDTVVVEEPAENAAAYAPELFAAGEATFSSLCAACHGQDARGLPNLGLNLVESEFVRSLSDTELRQFITMGRPVWDPANTTGVDMPPRGGNPALSNDDILAVIAYVRVLSGQGVISGESVGSETVESAPTATSAPLPTQGTSFADATYAPAAPASSADTSGEGEGAAGDYDPALVAAGEATFSSLCAACHGPDARGLPNLGLNLVESEFVRSLSDTELRQFITMGRPVWDPANTTGVDMPPRGGNPALSNDDIVAVIAYIRSIAVAP